MLVKVWQNLVFSQSINTDIHAQFDSGKYNFTGQEFKPKFFYMHRNH